jgi:hypothetical protein
MRFEVRIEEDKYIVRATNSFDAKVRAARQHFRAYPRRFTDPNDVLRSKIVVIEIKETSQS